MAEEETVNNDGGDNTDKNTDTNTDKNNQNNDGVNDDFLFSWQHGLGSPSHEDGEKDAADTPPAPRSPSSTETDADVQKRVDDYLSTVEVPRFEPNDEQRMAIQGGDFSALNEHMEKAHRDMHMTNLQTMNKMVAKAIEDAKKEMVQQANINNTATDIMHRVESQFPVQAKDKIVGPVIRSMVTKMMGSGETNIDKITGEVGKVVNYMGGVLGPAKDDSGGTGGRDKDANTPSYTEQPDNWTNFLKDL